VRISGAKVRRRASSARMAISEGQGVRSARKKWKGDAAMNQVIYRDGFKQAGPLRVAADKATQLLEEECGSLANTVSVEWDRGEDASMQSVLVLRLFDSDGSVTAVLEPKELEEPKQLRGRLRSLWRKLLDIRGRKLLASIQGWENS
jgi:hypothetical protein